MSALFVFSLTEPTENEVDQLVRVLQLDSRDSNHVVDELAKLPFALKRRKVLPNFVMADYPVGSHCSTHKGLNNRLIHSIFNKLALEVGLRLNVLVANNNRLTPQQWSLVSGVRELHGLWLDAPAYRKTFLHEPNLQWTYQADGCEACMLSTIISNPSTLVGIHAVLLSRTRSKSKYPRGEYPPTILRWIEAFIQTYNWRSDAMFAQSQEAAAGLKVIRKSIWKQRRSSRRHTVRPGAVTSSIDAPTQVAEDCGDIGSDFENEIIDHYAALTSTTHLPLYDTHVAVTTQRAPKGPSQRAPVGDDISTASVYSRAIDGTKPSVSTQVPYRFHIPGASADDYAAVYSELISDNQHSASSQPVVPESSSKAAGYARAYEELIGDNHRRGSIQRVRPGIPINAATSSSNSASSRSASSKRTSWTTVTSIPVEQRVPDEHQAPVEHQALVELQALIDKPIPSERRFPDQRRQVPDARQEFRRSSSATTWSLFAERSPL